MEENKFFFFFFIPVSEYSEKSKASKNVIYF